MSIFLEGLLVAHANCLGRSYEFPSGNAFCKVRPKVVRDDSSTNGYAKHVTRGHFMKEPHDPQRRYGSANAYVFSDYLVSLTRGGQCDGETEAG